MATDSASIIHNALGSAAAGIVGRIFTHPLDTVSEFSICGGDRRRQIHMDSIAKRLHSARPDCKRSVQNTTVLLKFFPGHFERKVLGVCTVDSGP